jgi:hypothetical protein
MFWKSREDGKRKRIGKEELFKYSCVCVCVGGVLSQIAGALRGPWFGSLGVENRAIFGQQCRF